MNYGHRAVLCASNLMKTYKQGDHLIRAVNNASFQIHEGDFVSITGASGSGKTTLLNIIGCVLRPDSGSLWIGDTDAANENDSNRARIRRNVIGYVFQDYKLLPALTARENICFPLRLAGKKVSEPELQYVAETLGIERCLDAFPSQLSGGQQQRVSIARAIIHQPQIILADEPTGNLDSQNTTEILRILSMLNAQGTTVLMVTHNERICNLCNRRLFVSDGCLTEIAEYR